MQERELREEKIVKKKKKDKSWKGNKEKEKEDSPIVNRDFFKFFIPLFLFHLFFFGSLCVY